MIQSYKDLEVFQLSYAFAREMKKITSQFPVDERYLLKDQLNRSSRSIPANIAEGWAKRKFDAIFRRQLVDAIGSTAESEVHLQFALDFGYLNKNEFDMRMLQLDKIGKMLNSLHKNWQKFPKENHH